MASNAVRRAWFKWGTTLTAISAKANKVALVCDRALAPHDLTVSQFKVRVNDVVRSVLSATGAYEAVTNGRFDTGITGWSNMSSGFMGLAYDAGEKYIYAQDLGAGWTKDTQGTILQNIPVSAAKRGLKVDLKVDMFASGGGAGGGVTYCSVDSMPGNVLVSSTAAIQGDNIWHRDIEASGVIPMNSTSLNVYLSFYPTQGIGTGSAYPAFDNIRLEVGNVVELTLASPVVAGDKVDVSYVPSTVLTDLVIEAAADGDNLPEFHRKAAVNATP